LLGLFFLRQNRHHFFTGLFEIEWALLGGCLCVFFRDKIGAFLYLAPLGQRNSPAVLKQAFDLMDKFNKEISPKVQLIDTFRAERL